MAIEFNNATAIGDSFEVHTNSPLIGVQLISGYSDIVLGETATRLFDREFKYSLNGVNYSGWVELTDQNLIDTFVGQTSIFDIRYRYTRAGTDTTGVLTFFSVQLEGLIEEVPNPKIFTDLYFSKFFNYNDASVLGWALNVLNKLYGRGIIANYMERGEEGVNDDDYIAFFGALTHFMAILVRYAREFKDFTLNDVLLNEYLNQKGVFVNDGMSLADLQTLLSKLYVNFFERGTNEIFKVNGIDGRVINGELLRLLRYSLTDELIFGLIEPEKTIWNVNNNSPMYRGTLEATNLTKAYEFEQDVQDLDNYPLLESGFITKFTDSPKEVIRVLNSTSSNIVGIGGALATDDLIVINPNINYEITFYVKQVILGASLSLGVKVYDKDKILLSNSMLDAVNGGNSDTIIDKQSLLKNDTYYRIRAILFNPNVSFDKAIGDPINVLDIGFGNHLVFDNDLITYLGVDLGTEINDGNNDLRIWDFKVRPLITSISNGFIMIPNIISSYLANNSELTNKGVKNKIIRYLTPYNTILKNEFVDEPFVFTGAPLRIFVTTQDETIIGADNGIISILATGGSQPYQYSIDNGVTFSSGSTFTNLPPANYDIVVEDSLGVQVTDNVTIGTGVSNLSLSLFQTPTSDVVTSDGQIQVIASGGVPPYLYSLDDITYVANNLFTGLGIGTQTVWVLDNAAQKVNDDIDVSVVRGNTVTVHVEDELSVDLENANVEVIGENYLTDVNGNVTIYLDDGSYTFTITKSGYKTRVESNIAVTSDRVVNTFMYTYYSITFNIDDGTNPLLNVDLVSTVTPVEQPAIIESPPNTGTIVVNNVISGSYTFEVSKLGYITTSESVNVNGNEIVNITVLENIIEQEFLNPGDYQWIVPTGVTSLLVECYGGGASGEGVNATDLGDGGAGASFASSTIAVTPGVVYLLTIGSGGIGTDSGISAGDASLFYPQNGNVIVLASGGFGRFGGGGFNIGDIIRSGGDGSQPSLSMPGTGGGGAGTSSNGGSAVGGTPGTGGGGLAGNGGIQTTIANTPGFSGDQAGGGGSGAWSTAINSFNGGNGGNGAIKLTYQQFI